MTHLLKNRIGATPLISSAARERLDEFVSTATEIFIAKGYRRAKMADVTGAMGLSEGAVYRYFEGKEALFDLVLRAAANPETPVQVDALPVPNPAPGETLECLRVTVAERTRFDSLTQALEKPGAGAEEEMQAIVGEIYAATSRFRTGLRLVERCAMDWPEVADLWFGGPRRQLEEQLVAYLADRAQRGWLRVGPGPEVTARVILELVAYFAAHRHRDPIPLPVDDELASAAVVDNVVHAYVSRQ